MSAYLAAWWQKHRCRCGHLRSHHFDPDDKQTPDWCLGDCGCGLYEPVDPNQP